MLVSEVPAFREYWYPISYSEEIGQEPYPFRLLGDDYVAWRPTPGDPVHAAVDECPHRSARLSQGWVEDGCLVCPYHGWRFAGDGACVEIPSNGPDVPVPPRATCSPCWPTRSTAWCGCASACRASPSRR